MTGNEHPLTRLTPDLVRQWAEGTIEEWLQGWTQSSDEVPVQHRVRLMTDGKYRFEPSRYADNEWPEQFFRILAVVVEDESNAEAPTDSLTRLSTNLKDRAAGIMNRDDLGGPTVRTDIETVVRTAYLLAALLDGEHLAHITGRALRHLHATNHPAALDLIQLVRLIRDALRTLAT